MIPDFNMQKYVLLQNRLMRNGFQLNRYDAQIQFSLEDMKNRTAERSTALYSLTDQPNEQSNENISRADRQIQIKERLVICICRAAKSHVQLPRNLNEYVNLLWKIYDGTLFFVQYVSPIVKRSVNSNIMRILLIILMDTKDIILKLIGFELDSADASLYIPWSNKLADNAMSCMRVLLACCIMQNKYSTANEILYDFSEYAFYLDTLSAFISISILQSISDVPNYIPNPRIFPRINCQNCKKFVSFAGCYCKHSTAALSQNEDCDINLDPLEDTACSSNLEYLTSWDSTLQLLLSVTPPKRMSALELMEYIEANKNFESLPQRPLTIRDWDETSTQETNKPPSISESIETIQDSDSVKRKNEDNEDVAIYNVDKEKKRKRKYTYLYI